MTSFYRFELSAIEEIHMSHDCMEYSICPAYNVDKKKGESSKNPIRDDPIKQQTENFFAEISEYIRSRQFTEVFKYCHSFREFYLIAFNSVFLRDFHKIFLN